MNKPTKERVEELAVLVKRAYVGSKCRDKNWRDLLAIVDDYAGWTSPGPTDADERAFNEWWTGAEMGDRYSRGFRALARDAWMASRPSAPRVSEADILETAMRIRFPAEEKAGVVAEPLKALLRSVGVSVESGEEE